MSKQYFAPFSASAWITTYALNRYAAQLDAALSGVGQGTFRYTDHTAQPVVPSEGFALYFKDGALYQLNSAGSETLLQSPQPSYAHLREEETSGTSGGAPAIQTWTDRILNTTVADDDGIVTALAANQFTLESGSYLIHARTPFGREHGKGRFYDVSNTTALVYGVNVSAGDNNYWSIIQYFWTIAAQTTYSIQYYTVTNNADGLGFPASLNTEIYTEVEIWKTA